MSYPVPETLTDYKDPLLELKNNSQTPSRAFFTKSAFRPDDKSNFDKSYKNDIDLLETFENYQLPRDPKLLQKKNIVVVDTGQRDWPRQSNAYSFTFSFGEKLGNTKGSILQTPYYYNNPLIPYAAYESTFFNQVGATTGLIDSAQHVNKYPKIIPGSSINITSLDGNPGLVGGKTYGWRRVIDTSGNFKHVSSDGADTIISTDIVEYYPVYSPTEPRGAFLGIDSSVQVLQNDNNIFSTQVKLANIASIRLLKATLPIRNINSFKNTIYNTNKFEISSNVETYSTVTVTGISSEIVSELPDIIIPNLFTFDETRSITNILRLDRSISAAGSVVSFLPSVPGTATTIYNHYSDISGITQYINGVTAMFGLKSTLDVFLTGCVAATSWNTISDCKFGIINVANHITDLTAYYLTSNTFADSTPLTASISTLSITNSNLVNQFTLSGVSFTNSLNTTLTTLKSVESNYYSNLQNPLMLQLTNSFQVALTACVNELSNIPDSNVRNTLNLNIITLSSDFGKYKTMINLLSSSAGYTNLSYGPYVDITNISSSVGTIRNTINSNNYLSSSFSIMNTSTLLFDSSFIPTNRVIINTIDSSTSTIQDIVTLINITNYSSAPVIAELSNILIDVSKNFNNLTASSSNLNGYPVGINTVLNQVNTSFNTYNTLLNTQTTSLFLNITSFFNRYSNIDYVQLSNISNTMLSFSSNAYTTFQIGANPSYQASVINAFTTMGDTAARINNFYLGLYYLSKPFIENQQYTIFYTDTFNTIRNDFFGDISDNNTFIISNYTTLTSNLNSRKINQNNIDPIATNLLLYSPIYYYTSNGPTLIIRDTINNNYTFQALFSISDTSKIWNSVDFSHNINKFSNTSGIFTLSGLLNVGGTLVGSNIVSHVTISSELVFDQLKYYNIINTTNTTRETKTVTKIVTSNTIFPPYSYESLDTFNSEPYILMKIDNMKGIYYGPTAGIQNAFATLVQTNKTSRNMNTDSVVPQYQDYQPWSEEAFTFDPPLSQLSNAIVTLVDPNDQQFTHIDDLNLIFIEFYPLDSPKFGKMKFYITKNTYENITNFATEKEMYNFFGTNEIRVGDEIGFYSGNIQQLLNDPLITNAMRIFFNFLTNQNVMVTDIFKINVESMYPLLDLAYAFDVVIKPFNLSNSYDIFTNLKTIIPEIQTRNTLLGTTCNVLDYNGNLVYPYDNEKYSNILVLQQYNVYSNIVITDQAVQYSVSYGSDYSFTKQQLSTLTRYFDYKHPIPIINKHLQSTFTFEVITMVPDKSELKIIKKK